MSLGNVLFATSWENHETIGSIQGLFPLYILDENSSVDLWESSLIA